MLMRKSSRAMGCCARLPPIVEEECCSREVKGEHGFGGKGSRAIGCCSSLPPIVEGECYSREVKGESRFDGKDRFHFRRSGMGRKRWLRL